MLNILLYIGAETLSNANPHFAYLAQPARVVMELRDPYIDRGRHLYIDRYYSSIQLAQELHNQGTYILHC